MQRARLKDRCRLLLLCLLIGLLVGLATPYACHAESIKTRADLLATLMRLRAQYPEWAKSYQRNVNDCSDMTSRLHRILAAEGYTAFVAVGWQLQTVTVDGERMSYSVPRELHAKVLCYVWSGGKVEATWVEATTLGICQRRFLPARIYNDVEDAQKEYPGEF
jgi:hypothetical protein